MKICDGIVRIRRVFLIQKKETLIVNFNFLDGYKIPH